MKQHMAFLWPLIAACATLPAVASAAWIPDRSHDSHRLSASETAEFLPVVCRRPSKTKGGVTCDSRIGTDESSSPPGASLSLNSIAYGGFTNAGEREAYISYTSDFEPHAMDFGGGILLRRAREAWKVVAWIPGGQQETCVAVPGSGPQGMLCLQGWTGMGETDSSVWINHVRLPGTGNQDTGILKAEDGREAANPKYYCDMIVPTHLAMLLSIDDLTRSPEQGTLAVSNITYATAPDVARACKRGDLKHVETKTGRVRYSWNGNGVTAAAPVEFGAPNY